MKQNCKQYFVRNVLHAMGFLAFSLMMVLVGAITSCTNMVFQPATNHYINPNDYNITVYDHYFYAEDNTKLHGWFLPPVSWESRGVILFSHGNAENISSHINTIYWLPRFGYGVFIYDYRGYGRSEGEPSIAGIKQDFQAALKFIETLPGYEKGVFIYGQSLGAAVSVNGIVNTTHSTSIKGAIIDGAFSSLREITEDIFASSWITYLFSKPLSYSVGDDFRVKEDITKIQGIPLLVIHSRDDRVIPIKHGYEIYKAANTPKSFIEAEGVGHMGLFTKPAYRVQLLEWLAENK